MTFDGTATDPTRPDGLIAFMAATAQAQAEATKAAQRARIEDAKAKDGHSYLGRKPSYTREQFDAGLRSQPGLRLCWIVYSGSYQNHSWTERWVLCEQTKF
jgi:hypothetical protein